MKYTIGIVLLIGLLLVILITAAGCGNSVSSTITAPTTQNQQPIEVVSVVGPLSPINPGGPIVEITLKNVSREPITSLSATLQLNRDFNFDFDVTPSNPMLPDKSVSTKLTLITGSFGDNIYSLMINGTLQNGVTFAYKKQVQILKQ